jgi:hypothetical protein
VAPGPRGRRPPAGRHRPGDRLPARPRPDSGQREEAEEAEDAGVRLRWLSTIGAAGQGTGTTERVELDESGKPQPPVILARGRDCDLSRGPMTGHHGIFVGGDMVPAQPRPWPAPRPHQHLDRPRLVLDQQQPPARHGIFPGQ